MQAQTLVIDGNNVVFYINHNKGELECLLSLIDFTSSFATVYPIISSELRYRIDKPNELKRLIKNKRVLVTPSNVDVDLFILETAKQLGAYIISNDQYRQYKGHYSETIGRRISFMIFRDHQGILRVILPELNYNGVIHHDPKPVLIS